MVLTPILPSDYKPFVEALKHRIRSAQTKAAIAVNRELILLYHEIGRQILEQQQQVGWGSHVIEQLAHDLHAAFPELKGFSARNLKYMRAFAKAYPDIEFVQTVSAQLSWSHHTQLLDRLKDVDERLFYMYQTIEHGWSMRMMMHHIATQLYQRQGKALTNFKRTLPDTYAQNAQHIFKDPYVFDFINLGYEAVEADVEHSLVSAVEKFLVELGRGFAFVGRQYHLEVGGKDFYLDLLFYHLKLRCYVVVELKAREFDAADVGQLNLYLSAIDDLLRHPDDQPSIGLLLCRDKNKVVVEYALRDFHKPIGVSSFELKILEELPSNLQSQLPTIEQLEEGLSGM